MDKQDALKRAKKEIRGQEDGQWLLLAEKIMAYASPEFLDWANRKAEVEIMWEVFGQNL